MQTPLSAMPPPQPVKVETQYLASPGGTMRLSSSQICMIILPWTPRETQDFASLHGCRRQSSIEGMRSIHRIHGKVETQHLASPEVYMHILSVSYSISISLSIASPEVYMHPSLSYYIIRILPWFSRETQDFASLQGCRRQSSIEGMRSIHRIHDKVETQHLASPDEPIYLSSSSYSIHITLFLQYCPAPTASRYAAWRAVRCKCWQSYSGHLQLNDI